MENFRSFHTRAYEKSADFVEQTLLQRTITLAKVVPILIVKVLIVICALIYHLIQQIVYCFVQRPLTNIRGQLAVVSVMTKIFSISLCYLHLNSPINK